MTGTLALPVVLPFLLVQALAGRRVSAGVASLVAALYAPDRLDALDAAPGIGERLVTRS